LCGLKIKLPPYLPAAIAAAAAATANVAAITAGRVGVSDKTTISFWQCERYGLIASIVSRALSSIAANDSRVPVLV
jgi:hypothetical protein